MSRQVVQYNPIMKNVQKDNLNLYSIKASNQSGINNQFKKKRIRVLPLLPQNQDQPTSDGESIKQQYQIWNSLFCLIQWRGQRQGNRINQF
ncbi:hypothetical protein FGO68_gene7409 [Halteria grandinella]|uniref:Uncharacterized protein n=1 Tax=Halteria grandinella TaxID=5974 RepID=A0A8J8NX77_HALGN|nr:hypothetical protein FGO68_gene7409 [Halteria grandinella]